MDVYERLVDHKAKLALVGLGYVGMPIAVAFAKQIDVIGFDFNKEKIAKYKSGIDPTNDHPADDGYIALSRGRDWSDCPIESGVFRGYASQHQTVHVTVSD